MKPELLEQIQSDTVDWKYMEELPEEWHGFTKRIVRAVEHSSGDKYDLFLYENKARHLSAVAYFHEETKEYKLRVAIGLTEFCQIQYIAAKLSMFQQELERYLDTTLHNLVVYNPKDITYITRQLKIPEWDYHSVLPEELCGFKLFIHPKEMLHVLNGSYIVADYSDFAIDSNFIIYYNEFRCEFYGEARICSIPDMNYIFDSHNLIELEEKLREHLVPRLQEIRQRAEQQIEIRESKGL